MNEKLFVAWQNEQTRFWHTIAEIVRKPDGYEFGFTKGVSNLLSIPEQLFRMNLNSRYTFKDLIPLFRNRIPPRSRSDFVRMAGWLNLSSFADEFEMLSYFGLIPGTDSLMIYPSPIIDGDTFRLTFFVHGIRHMHQDAMQWCAQAQAGERLLAVLDAQNHVDRNAVALRSENDALLIGYIPAFYAKDIRQIILDADDPASIAITVVRCNPDAPTQLRLLCRIDAPVRPGFLPLDTDDHKPLVSSPPPAHHARQSWEHQPL